jgi:hypothetical protein
MPHYLCGVKEKPVILGKFAVVRVLRLGAIEKFCLSWLFLLDSKSGWLVAILNGCA